jgi:hypothetical protein
VQEFRCLFALAEGSESVDRTVGRLQVAASGLPRHLTDHRLVAVRRVEMQAKRKLRSIPGLGEAYLISLYVYDYMLYDYLTIRLYDYDYMTI